MAFPTVSIGDLNDIKVLVIGDTGAGKTALIKRFCGGDFTEGDEALTTSAEFMTRQLELDGQMQPVQVWDTAGQERFRTITSTYYKNAQGIIIVYNVDDYPSFRNVSQWLQEIERYGNQDVCKLLIGNKTDLVENRVVNESEAMELAESAEMGFFETSAKTGDNVDDAFTAMVKQIARQRGPLPGSGKGSKKAGLLKRLRTPADSSPTIHSGWVVKRGGRLPHKWQKRWFLLSNQDITYSAGDDMDSRIRGTIYLVDVVCLEKLIDETYFNIVTPKRTYECQVENGAARNSWLKHIESAAKKGKIVKQATLL